MRPCSATTAWSSRITRAGATGTTQVGSIEMSLEEDRDDLQRNRIDGRREKRAKKSPAEAGLLSQRSFSYGFGFGLASGFASGLASGFGFGSGFSARPTTSTVTLRFGARHSMSCLRFILLSQNLVTGIGCFGPLPSQKISF